MPPPALPKIAVPASGGAPPSSQSRRGTVTLGDEHYSPILRPTTSDPARSRQQCIKILSRRMLEETVHTAPQYAQQTAAAMEELATHPALVAEAREIRREERRHKKREKKRRMRPDNWAVTVCPVSSSIWYLPPPRIFSTVPFAEIRSSRAKRRLRSCARAP